MATPNKPYCVYIYRDPRPGKERVPVYVGSGRTDTRPRYHWAGYSGNPRLAELIIEMKRTGLRPIIELVELFDNRDDASRLEKELISKYRETLYNHIGGTKFPVRVPIVMDLDHLRVIDNWRRRQEDLPSRTEAVRRMIDLAIRNATTTTVKSEEK